MGVKACNHRFLRADRPRHAQAAEKFLLHPAYQFLFVLIRLLLHLHDGVMNPVVEHGRRNHLVLRMFLLLQLHGRVQIDHQLKLQAVVQGRQAEIPAARFIIDDLHINPVLSGRTVLPRLPPGVHPVDPAS